MIQSKAYTRITLSLDIIQKFLDGPYKGFHELGIIKHQIKLHDVISIKPSAHMKILCDHPQVPCDNTNICWKAVSSIKNRFGITENVEITLDKNIPVQGGLAGGSANGAVVLSLCNALWNLNMSHTDLVELGRGIGMDVPFFFTGATAYDTEAGCSIESIPTAVSFNFVLVIPPFGVSTALAYRTIDYNLIAKRRSSTQTMKELLSTNAKEAAIAHIHNDFELSVAVLHPELLSIKQKLLDLGCSSSCMTGSGSTLYGIAKDREHAQWVCRHIPYQTIVTESLCTP